MPYDISPAVYCQDWKAIYFGFTLSALQHLQKRNKTASVGWRRIQGFLIGKEKKTEGWSKLLANVILQRLWGLKLGSGVEVNFSHSSLQWRLCSGFGGKLWCQPPFQQLHLVMPPSRTVYTFPCDAPAWRKPSCTRRCFSLTGAAHARQWLWEKVGGWRDRITPT